MSSSIPRFFESIIGNARFFHAHSRAHDDLFHWTTAVGEVIFQHTNSNSVHDKSVAAKKDTRDRDWREFVVSTRR